MATKAKHKARGAATPRRAKAAARSRRQTTKRAAAPVQPRPVDIDPGWAWDDALPFVQGKQIGNLIYVSGQVGLDANGTLVGEGDIKAQTRQAFENLKTVLAAAGAGIRDIIKMNAYITDAGAYRDVSEVRNEILAGHKPASTLVAVPALAFPGLMIEVEAIALKP